MPDTRSLRHFSLRGLIVLIGCPAALAIEREDVDFSVVYETVFGQSVYVLGDIPELGANDPAYAVKLEPSSYPNWKATIAIPAGTEFTYVYTWRDDDVASWSDPSNHNPIGDLLAGATLPFVPQPSKKGLFYYSSWNSPVIAWRTRGETNFVSRPMAEFGHGRVEGESRWRALGVGSGERVMEFFFTDGGTGRDPAAGYYATRLDAFLVQDGAVFEYAPAHNVSPQRRDYLPSNPPGVESLFLGELRRYRVLLPRGYDEHPERRYPVLYMHDGQNIFEIGPFGSWHADDSANLLTRQGVMREIIIVGIDNTQNRIWDYMAPDDIVPFGPGAGQPGRADDYAAFLIEELKPLIDAEYRTLSGRDHTATVGSSMGGVVSLYLGWDHNEVFGRCGPMSGAWQFGNFPNRVMTEAYRVLRVYFDSGDCCGGSTDNAWGTMALRDNLLSKGYALQRGMLHVVGYGDQHNEAAWEARLPFAYEFLFPVTEAENYLLDEIFMGDADGNGEIDLQDHQYLPECLSGPDAPSSPACPHTTRFDADGDGDIDLKDAAVVATCFSG